MVEKMSDNAVKAVVELHVECFKDSFLANLDSDILARMYENYVTSELGRAYAYVDNGKVVGFVAGAINPSVYYNQMIKKRGLGILWLTLKRAFREPKFLVSIARRSMGGFFRPDESEDAYRKASLDVIAVKREYRNRGIARQLAETFLNELRKSDVSNVTLGVSPENMGAKRFYEKIGFEHFRTESHPDGKQVCIYGTNLDEKNTGPGVRKE